MKQLIYHPGSQSQPDLQNCYWQNLISEVSSTFRNSVIDRNKQTNKSLKQKQ